jgi:hypothetical protein
VTPELKRRLELRRVMSTIAAFASNLAYREAMWNPWLLGLIFGKNNKPLRLNFWMVTNSSCLQTAILEWAKLFGKSDNERHHWRNILTDPVAFETSLLDKLSKTKSEYDSACKILLHYRDKTVAHLDPEVRLRTVPQMDMAKASVWHYAKHIFDHEVQGDEVANLIGSIEQLETEFNERVKEAQAIFWREQGYTFPMPPTDPEEFRKYIIENPQFLTGK